MDDQSAQQNCVDDAPWYAQCDQGNQRAADGGVVGCFGGNDACFATFAELAGFVRYGFGR